MPDIQIFGRKGSRETRACLRFFKERRIDHRFVDLSKRAIAPGELKRFTQRLGAAALLDEGSKAYADAGLAYLRLDDRQIFDRLLEDSVLLRLPLVRRGEEVTVGVDEDVWKAWVADGGQ